MSNYELNEDIKISVLIPVFNVEKYLRDCIESVLKQTVQVYEIILVDDGSTDSSGTICDQYSSEYSIIHTFHNKNQGQLFTRCYAINHAKGNWFIFLDSDDKLKENAVETILMGIRKYHPDCIIYGFDRVNEGKVINAFKPEIECEQCIDNKADLYSLVFTHRNLNPLWRKAVSAKLLTDDYSEYNRISLGEDLLQSIEIYKNGTNFLFLPESLYNYTFNEKSITHTIKACNYKVDFTVREKVLDFLRSENIFSENQWNIYDQFSLANFINQLKVILTLDAEFAEIKGLLIKSVNSNYFTSYISNISSINLSKLDLYIFKSIKSYSFAGLYMLYKIYRIKRKLT